MNSQLNNVALLIGCDNYSSTDNKLNYAVNHINKIDGRLQSIQFQRIVTVQNPTSNDLKKKAKDFLHDSADANVILIYFCGKIFHNGEDAPLLPIDDDDVNDSDDLSQKWCSLQLIFGWAKEAVTKNRKLKNSSTHHWPLLVILLDTFTPYIFNQNSRNNSQLQLPLKIQNDYPRYLIQYVNNPELMKSDLIGDSSEHHYNNALVESICEADVEIKIILEKVGTLVQNRSRQKLKPSLLTGKNDTTAYLKLNPLTFNYHTLEMKPSLLNRNKHHLALIIDSGVTLENIDSSSNMTSHSQRLCGKLNQLGFSQLDSQLHVSRENLIEGSKRLFRHIPGSTIVLIYFCGETYQEDGETYLVPKAKLHFKTALDLQNNSLPINRFFVWANDEMSSRTERKGRAAVDQSKWPLLIVLLDSFKSNVFNANNSQRELQVRRKRDYPRYLIQYSHNPEIKKPSSSANPSEHYYNDALLETINELDLEIKVMLEKVGVTVEKSSRGMMSPLLLASGAVSGVYLIMEKNIYSVPDLPLRIRWESEGGVLEAFKRLNTSSKGYGKSFAFKEDIRGPGSDRTRFRYPQGLFVHDKCIYVVDSANHRILKVNRVGLSPTSFAGSSISGYDINRFCNPSDIIYHESTKSFVVCDHHNRRILQIPKNRRRKVETVMNSIACFGIATDDDGFIYASDTEKHRVLRFSLVDDNAIVVAGNNGQGARLHQLNYPTYLAIGTDWSVYVSDSHNNRVMKWSSGAASGVIVAGGNGIGRGNDQLHYPAGLVVDRYDRVFVCDSRNHRVMCWIKDAKAGVRIVGDQYLGGNFRNQLLHPEGLRFDENGNLVISDSENHRIIRFAIMNTQ